MAVWSQPSLIDTYSNRRIDSEFFGPKYIQTENLTRQCATDDLGRLGVFMPGPFGSAFHVKNYDFRSPFRYIRGKDVKPFFLLEDDNRYVPESVFYRLQSYAVGPDDLMISVVGTLGNVSICTTNDTPAIFSCKSTLFRTQKIDPYYLLAFLNCHYGSLCLLRRQRGAVQTGLNIEDLRTVPIPRFGSTVESRIAQDVRNAYQSLLYSKKNYAKAQQLLESELGLDKLSFQKPVAYTARFSEVVGNGRMDADYYQIKYKQLDDIAAKFPVKKIKTISEKLETGVYSKSYSADGRTYLRGVDINAGFIDGDSILRTKCLMVNPQNTVIKDDILVTRVGSIGVCAIIEDTFSGSFYSDNLIRIRLYDQAKKEISASYLNLLLNTTYGQMQMVRYSRGSVQQRLNQSQLAQIPLPIIRWERQLEIENLLKKHRQAKKESKHLLEQAKTRVVQLIEEAVKS